MADVAQLVMATAQREGVDPRLALEVAIYESKLDQSAVSPAGAIGVMQLEPATAAEMGVDPTNLEQNLLGGVRYLGKQLARFGSVPAALAAYDWGPRRVAAAMTKWGTNWLERAPTETRKYVSTILGRLATQYQVSVQPAEVVRNVVQSLPDTQKQAIQTALILAAVGIGIYLAIEELF